MKTTQIKVLNSGIWQLSSTIIASNGECLVIDPGYFPRELDDLVQLSSQMGKTKQIVFTHGHWDHVIGWTSFPDATVWGSKALQRAVSDKTPEALKNLKDAQEFDSRWYIKRPTPLSWPNTKALEEGQVLTVGDLTLQTLEVPGHSPDGLALRIKEEKVLIVGDYLSPLEIPFVDDLNSYQKTLHRFLALLPQINEVIPGHGPRLTAKQAQEIILADLQYLRDLEDCAKRKDHAAGLEITLPRAKDVVGMRDFHIENCEKVGLKKSDT